MSAQPPLSPAEYTATYSCAFCGEPAEWMYYAQKTMPGPICGNCADEVANAYWMAHAGRWLTRPNPPAPKPTKAKIPAAIRRAVFERDEYRCVTCRSHIDLTLDHIYPESLGGETSEANLQTMCRTCNLRKGVTV